MLGIALPDSHEGRRMTQVQTAADSLVGTALSSVAYRRLSSALLDAFILASPSVVGNVLRLRSVKL